MSYFYRLSKLTSLEKINNPNVTYNQMMRTYGNLASVNARITQLENAPKVFIAKGLLDQYTAKLQSLAKNYSFRAATTKRNLQENIIQQKKEYIKAIQSANPDQLKTLPIEDLIVARKQATTQASKTRIDKAIVTITQTTGVKIPVTLINLTDNKELTYQGIIDTESITGSKMVFGEAKINSNYKTILEHAKHPIIVIPDIKITYNGNTLTNAEIKDAFPKTVKFVTERKGITIETPTGIEYKQQIIRVPHTLALEEKIELVNGIINLRNYYIQTPYFKPVDYITIYDRKPTTRADKLLDKTTSEDFQSVEIDFSIRKVPNLGDSNNINCVISIIKDHISQETYDHFKDKPRLTDAEIRHISKKEKITINFYDILKYPWARTSSNIRQKQFNIVINNNHAIQCKIEDSYEVITPEIVKNASAIFHGNDSSIKYYLYNDKNTNTLKRIFNKYLYQCNDSDLKPGRKIISNFAAEILDQLPYDNHYTKNLQYVYPGCTIINDDMLGSDYMFNPTKEGIYAYDSNKHFQKKLSEPNVLPYPPNQYKILNFEANQNNIPDELNYNGFAYITNVKSQVKYVQQNYKENCCLYSQLLLFLLKRGVIECTIYSISYNKVAQNIDMINMAFMERFDMEYLKEFNQPGCHKPIVLQEGEILFEEEETTDSITREKEKAHKVLFNTTIGMLKESIAKPKQFERIRIKTKDKQEREHLFANHEFVTEDGEDYIVIHQEKEPKERCYYNYMWYAVVQMAEIAFLEFYLNLDETKISHTYVDCIYTKQKLETIPDGWKQEDKDQIFKRRNNKVKQYELPNFKEEVVNDTIRSGPGGCGKTYELIKNPPSNSILITFTRNLLEEHEKLYNQLKTDQTNELHFNTIHTFFNITTKYPYTQGKHYSNIIIDEVGLISSDIYYSHIREYILTHRYQNFIFTRGMRQLFATNSIDYIHKHIIADINPTIVEFTDNKRILCDELKQRIASVKNKTNNQEWLEVFADRVIDTTTMFDMYDAEHDVGVASRNIRIDALNQTAVNLYDTLVYSDDGKIQRIPKPDKVGKKELAYFQTFHKQQGNTIRQPAKLFVIIDRLFDIYMMDMSIGRVQYLDQIYLVTDESFQIRNDIDEFDCAKQAELERCGPIPHNIVKKNTPVLPPIYHDLKKNIKICTNEIEKRKQYIAKPKTRRNILEKYNSEIIQFEKDLAYYKKCIVPFDKLKIEIDEQKKSEQLVESMTRYEQYQIWLAKRNSP